MRYTLFCISIFNILLFGCTKSQVKDSLKTSAHSHNEATITILSNDLNDKKFAKCLQSELGNDLPKIKFFPEDNFRDDLFPWFEPGTAPKEIIKLSALLNKEIVRKRIESLGIEILIYVQGATTRGESDGFMMSAAGPAPAVGVVGYTSSDRETHMRTSVWNLKEAASIGDTDIHVKGKARWLGLIIPIPIPAFSESEACSETAERISNFLKGKDLYDDK
jgi:hypothetical protein